MNKPLEVLKKYWGHDSFRGPQKDTIESILSGVDTMSFARTGLGKTVMFQVPALCLDGVTVVVSPLKSLQKDQVDNCIAKGIPVALINSDTGKRAREKLKQQLRDETLKILYVSPETLFSEGFSDILELLVKVPLLAIDEAHCCSAWSDFRPKYRELFKAREDFFPDAVLLAVTATADEHVIADIQKYLGFGTKFNTFKTSFDRENISYFIKTPLKSEPVIRQVAKLIREKHAGAAGIIFCNSQKKTEETAKMLSLLGFNAKHFHAKIKKSEKEDIQEKFIKGEIDVICATIAFGMGIDHPSVRYVIHLDAPNNFDDYSQQCVTLDSLISTPTGYKRAKDVQVGDVLITFDHKTKVNSQNPVVEVFNTKTDSLYDIYTSYGHKLSVTGNHPILANEEYIDARNVKEGDVLGSLNPEEKPEIVVAVVFRSVECETINFSVLDNNNFYVSNVLTHNCGRASRDGAPAAAYMFYETSSYNSSLWLLRQTTTNPERMKVKTQKLQEFHNFCKSNICRRRTMLAYFGEKYPKANCGSCDVCLRSS